MVKKKIVFITIFLFVFLTFFSCQRAQNAQWITIQQNASQPNQWLCFRKAFHVDEVKIEDKATIAVDSRYWLWINDSLIIKEGNLLRNPNPNDTYADQVNIAPFLKEGENTIAILVNYFGRNGFNHNSSGMAGLYFDSHSVKSDASWKVNEHPAISDWLNDKTNYRYAESNMVFDANKNANWTSPSFNDKHWLPAKALGIPPVAPWNNLIKRSIPMHKIYMAQSYEDVTKNGDTLICSLPYDAQVYPYFKVKASKNEEITVLSNTFALGNKRHHNGLLLKYITKDGLQEYEMFRWIAGEKIYYIIPEHVEVVELGYRETGYNTEFSAYFHCDDPFLNKLWKKSRRTLYVCMRDHFMDCPDRERSLYAGDAGNTMMQTFYTFDTNAHAINQKMFNDVFNWQRQDSTFYMPYGGWFYEELPLQNLYLTGYLGIYQYYLHTGDIETIRNIYPSIKKYHALWKLNNKGLVKQRRGEWYWVDWGENKDERLLDNILYALALKGDIQLAAILGKDNDRLMFQKQYNSLRKNINKHYWQKREYRSINYTGKTDDRGNALAVLAGIADESQYHAISNVLMKYYHASPYMERFVLEALFEMNRDELALKRMKQRFGPMVKSDCSTLWETWKSGGTSSDNHAWSGSALHLLSQHVTGIKPVEPGFSRFEIIPNVDLFSRIQNRIVTLHGIIDIHVSHEEWQFLVEVDIPPSTSALVGVPKKYFKNTLKVNGKIMIDHMGRKERIDEIQNVEIVNENDDYLYLNMKAGKWIVETF